MSKRSYQQNCALAIALDLIGDRWTLLIVRELLIMPRQFTQLLRNLPGIGTNLLTDRLAQLVADGIVFRIADGGHPIYQLSPKGHQLESTVYELIQWGMSFNERRNEQQHHVAEWNLLPLRTVFRPEIGKTWRGSYLFAMGASKLRVKNQDGQLVLAKQDSQTVAEIHLSLDTAVGVFNGKVDWPKALIDGRIVSQGEALDVELFFTAFGFSKEV